LDNWAQQITATAKGELVCILGEHNIADAPSRGCRLRQEFTETQVQIEFPEIAEYTHPFSTRPKRPFIVYRDGQKTL
jgi:hypothetical protein